MANSDLGVEGQQALDAMGAGDDENTLASETQTANANVPAEDWKGNPAYFQTGKKAGKLRPSSRAKVAASDEFEGLKTDDLTATVSDKKPSASESGQDAKKRISKAERKATEGRVAAALVMRVLDTVADWLSRGELGRDWNQDQISARLTYREQLERDWAEYLATLDVPLHPGLVCIVGSVMYVAPALHTDAGQSRLSKIKGWIASRFAR